MSKVAIQCLPSNIDDGTRLASRLGVPIHPIKVHRFPDGEMGVTIGPIKPTTIIYASLNQPNDKLLAILFAAEALRRGGAKHLVLLAPYLCYMRQDAAFHPGEAISQKAAGRFIAGLVDRVITVDAHLHRTAKLSDVFPGITADNLSAMPAIADALRIGELDPQTVVVGPDAESQPWVSDLAGRLGLAHTVAQKTRHNDRSVEVRFADTTLFAGRPVLLVDDIVSSGGTLITCAKIVMAAGAKRIEAVVTHALFSAELANDFAAAGIRSIRSTYSVPHPTNAIGLDDVFVAALRSEMTD